MSDEKYPEHQKLKARKYKTEIVHEFLEWVHEAFGYELCRSDEWGNFSGLATRDRDEALAEFIEVNMRKIEDEKVAMLDEIRKAQEVKK